MFSRPALIVTTALACASAAVPSAATAASGLPKGKYWCNYYDDSTMGTITIKSATSYAYNGKKTGKYKATKSSITFTSGPMKGVFKKGKVVRNDGKPYFLLFDGDSYGHAYTDAKCFRTKA